MTQGQPGCDDEHQAFADLLDRTEDVAADPPKARRAMIATAMDPHAAAATKGPPTNQRVSVPGVSSRDTQRARRGDSARE